MDDRNIRRFERANRVQIFDTEHPADFDPASRTAAFFLELDPIIGKLKQADLGQFRGPVGKAALIEALSVDFKDITRTARAIKLDDPAFDDAPYRHPATSSEIPVTTHADSLLELLEDDTRPVEKGGDTPERLTAKAALGTRFIAFERFMSADDWQLSCSGICGCGAYQSFGATACSTFRLALLLGDWLLHTPKWRFHQSRTFFLTKKSVHRVVREILPE